MFTNYKMFPIKSVLSSSQYIAPKS